MIFSWRITQPGDVPSLRLRSWDKQGVAMQPKFDSILHLYNYAFTALADRTPYLVAGGYYTAPGVLDIFVLTDQQAPRYARNAVKACAEMLDVVEEEGIRRVQSLVPVGLGASRHLLKYLGFEIEAQLKCYFPDSDAYLFAKVSKRYVDTTAVDRSGR